MHVMLGKAGLQLNTKLEFDSLPAFPHIAVGTASERKAINQPIPALLSMQSLEAYTK